MAQGSKLSIRERFAKVRSNVEKLLIEFPETRRDIFTLVLRYWKEFDGVNIKLPSDIRDSLTRYETIVRRRHEIQRGEGRFKSNIPSPRQQSLTDFRQ